MNGNEGKGYFGIGLDTSELEKSKNTAISLFDQIAKQAEESGKIMDDSLSSAIKNVEDNFNKLDPDFGNAIQLEIDKNVSALEELKVKISEVGQEGIDLATGNFKEQTEQLYTDVDGINAKLEELDAEINSVDTPIAKVEELWKEYGLLIQELEKKESLLTELENKYQQSEEGQLLEKNSEAYAKLNIEAQQLQSTIEQLESVQSAYNTKAQETANEQANIGNSFEDVVGKISPMDTLLQQLPQPLRGVVTGLNGMTGAAKKFIAIPLIAVISAIVLGLQALTKYFTSSAEGQMKFAKITGYVTGVLDQLMEIVISVGEVLFDAFTNPQEAVKKLWEVIKENIVNRIKGLGKIFESIGTIITSGFTKGYKELGDAVIQTTTGVEDLVGKSKAYLNNLDEMGKKTAALSVRTEQLSRDRSNWMVEEETLNSKIAEARNKLYSAENDELKKKAALELEGYVNAKYEKRIEFANEELAIKKEMNSLTTNAQADYDAENNLQAELLRLQTQRTNELSRSERIMGSLNRKEASGKSAYEIQAEKVLEYRQELERLEGQLNRENYELNKSSMDRRLDVIEAEFNYELALIQKNKVAFQEMYSDIEGLDTSSFDALMAVLFEKRAKQEKDYLDNLLKEYQTVEEKRNSIILKYANDRTDLERSGASDATLSELNNREKSELAKFDNLVQDKTSIISRMFADVSRTSIEELKKIREEAEALLDFLSGGEWDEEKGKAFGITQEQFNEFISDPQKLESFRKGVDDIKDAILELDTPINKIKVGLKELFDPKTNDTKKQLEALRKIESGYKQYADAINTVSGAIGALGDLAGSNTLSSIAEGLSEVVNVANEAMEGAMTGAMVAGPVGAVVGGVLGAVKGIASAFSKNKQHREELRKQVEENQRQEYFGQLEIEAIWRSKYEWSKKIGESTLSHIKREGEELKKQAKENEKAQADLWSKLRQEQYKSGEHFKKTGLFGWGKGKIVEEWSSLATKSWEQIEELASQGKLSEEGERFYEALKQAKEEGKDLEQMQIEYLEKMREIYTGTSYEGLVSGIVDAFKQGERSAKDFADSFEDLLENAITSSLQLLADDAMREWYEDFAKKGEDGFTQDELDQLKADWIRLNENLAEQATALEEATGVVIGGTEQQQGRGNVGVYEKVTQDQWSETDGLFRGMHMVSLQNSEYLKSITGWGENINDMRNIALDSWSELVGINKNTKLLNETNEILTDLKRNGIKVL